MKDHMPPIASVPEWFTRAIESLQRGDIDSWMQIYATNAIHEFPFASEGAPLRLSGLDAISDYLRRLPELVRFGPITYTGVREVGDELIIEATGHHRRVSDNASKNVTYVWFITLYEGKITHFRDYMNPLELAAF